MKIESSAWLQIVLATRKKFLISIFMSLQNVACRMLHATTATMVVQPLRTLLRFISADLSLQNLLARCRVVDNYDYNGETIIAAFYKIYVEVLFVCL